MAAADSTARHSVVDVATRPGDIALGPDHPTLDGLPELRLRQAGGVVAEAEWIPGTVHRGAEKLFESRDYRQILHLVDRHDWLSAFCSEIALAVGVERALGITPAERAQDLRILLAELTRIAHHLAFLAPLPGHLTDRWRQGVWAWREEILTLIEQATGHRVHPMFCQVGGVRSDVTPQWVGQVTDAASEWASGDRYGGLLNDGTLAAVLDSSYADVAVLSTELSLGFGASGPVARASGVDLDLRRDDPTLPYPPFAVPLERAGDARARVQVLVAEVAASVGLVAWAAGRLAAVGDGPVAVRLPKVLRVPEGTSYTWTENPGGINGYLLVSRNDRTPWRLKLRSAGFANAAALGAALVGTHITQVPGAVASFLLVCGDIDR